MHPLRPFGILENRGKVTLVLVWLIGIIISSPQIMITRTEPFKYGNQTFIDCREDWEGIGGEIVCNHIHIYLCHCFILMSIYFYTKF